MRNRLFKNRICRDPNKEVERWKDKAYEEIKGLIPSKVGEYMERKAEKILKHYGVYSRIEVIGENREKV